ncbi:hypothetical protein D3C85_1238320 [compost metagenome]
MTLVPERLFRERTASSIGQVSSRTRSMPVLMSSHSRSLNLALSCFLPPLSLALLDAGSRSPFSNVSSSVLVVTAFTCLVIFTSFGSRS